MWRRTHSNRDFGDFWGIRKIGTLTQIANQPNLKEA